MAQLFTNNATSTLAADITDVATSLTVATGHGARFPAITGSDFFLVTLEKPDGTREIVAVTARSGDVLSGISRAQEGTTAVAFTTGDTVELRVTAETMADALVAPPQIYAGAMREIATVTTTGSQATVTFSGIPSTYRDLMVVVNGRGTTAAALETLNVRFNGDSSAIYDSFIQNREGYGVRTRINQTSAEVGNVEAATGPTAAAARIEMRIGEYAGTLYRKAFLMNQTLKTAEATASFYHQFGSGWWRSTSAITQVELFLSAGGFVDGSTVTLYGIGGEVGGAALNPIYTKYDPFCPPLNPSSLNDEFDVEGSGTGAPPGFTSVGAITPTYVARKGRLVLTAPASSADSAGIEKVLPSGPFTIATHGIQLASANFSVGGLYVRSSVSGRRLAIAQFFSGQLGNGGVTVAKYPSFSARDSFADTYLYDRKVFTRLSFDGTTLQAQFSVDGAEWTTLLSEAITTYFTSGNLPDRFGIDLRPENGGATATIAFDFFRHFPVGDADIGRNIGVGSDGTVVSTLPLLLHGQVI
jgi:hypothetical protein